LASLALGIILVVAALRRAGTEQEPAIDARSNWFDTATLTLIAVPLLLSLIASLAPPTAKDTLLYHFAVPKAFVAQGSSAFVEGNIASYLALGTEMHVTWAMLLGGLISERAAEAAAGATVWLFFPLLLAAIYGWARGIDIERRWALIAVLMLAAVPTAYHVAASGYNDVSLALFVTLAIYALVRWWGTLKKGWLVLLALFLGAALSTKLTALLILAAFTVVMLIRVRNAQKHDPVRFGKVAAAGISALVLAVVVASPWFLRTWMETGSPVFPFYLRIWNASAPGWDVERSSLYQAMNSQYGGYNKTLLDYLLAPWNLSVAAQPEIATHFDGVLGVAFLIGLPLLVWAIWKFEMPAEAKIGAGVAAVMFLFWLFSSQQLRYLLPVLPVIAIAIAAAAMQVSGRRMPLHIAAKYSIFAACMAGLAVSAGWFLQKAPLRVVLGGESRDAYLSRDLDHYDHYRWLNTETPADAKVWLINMRRDTYHIDRPVFSDYLFEDWTLRQMVWDTQNAEELKAKAAAMGVDYILARHDFLFDYDRSTLVDDSRPRAENEMKLANARALLLDPGRTVRSDAKFSLVRIDQ